MYLKDSLYLHLRRSFIKLYDYKLFTELNNEAIKPIILRNMKLYSTID